MLHLRRLLAKQEHRIRITGGESRGQKIFVPPGFALRPTSSKVRSALFDILSHQIIGATFLDLYAGTGAIGIEAISRGASMTYFVEQDKHHLKNLESNLEICHFRDKSEVISGNALGFLKQVKQAFDIIFVDPPYAAQEIEKTLISLKQGDKMSPGSRLIFEHHYKHSLPKETGKIYLEKQYQYGDTVLSFYGKS